MKLSQDWDWDAGDIVVRRRRKRHQLVTCAYNYCLASSSVQAPQAISSDNDVDAHTRPTDRETDFIQLRSRRIKRPRSSRSRDSLATGGDPSEGLVNSVAEDGNQRVALRMVAEPRSSPTTRKWSLVDPRKRASVFRVSAFGRTGERRATEKTPTSYEHLASERFGRELVDGGDVESWPEVPRRNAKKALTRPVDGEGGRKALDMGRRLDHGAFLGNKLHLQPVHPDARLIQPAQSAHPTIPSSDDDAQPALVRYARLKQREQNDQTSTHRPSAPRVFTSHPNPERWALKDTTVNVATAFHQAASSGMQTYTSHHNNAWASGSNRPNPAVPRSSSAEYEKEAQHVGLKNRLAPPPSRLNNPPGAGLRPTTGQGQRKPVSKMASVHHVPDSEGEPDNDPDPSDRAKSPLNQVIDVAKRALAPATFYLRQRSQEPDTSVNGQNSTYDYSAEEREFQANNSKTNSISGHRMNRMSVDNKAYKPSLSDRESSEEHSDDDDKGRRRRKKKKKTDPVGGPLTTLPVMAADKRKRRRSKGKSGTGDDEEEDEESGSETNTAAFEKASNPRASVARSSVPPASRQSVRGPETAGEVSLGDAEQGLQSIPEVEGEDEAEVQETHARHTALSPVPISIQSPVPFSIGAVLGRVVHLSFKTCLNTFVFAVHLLSGLFFVMGRILGTIVEIILIRPFRIAGLVGSQSNYDELQPQRPAKPFGKYLLIGLTLLGAWYAIQEPNKLPFSLPISPLFGGKAKPKHDQVFVAPSDVPANFAEFLARLKAVESAMSDLSRIDGNRANSHDDLLGRLDDLADRVSREARERKRVLDSVEGKVRDGVEGAVKRIEENVERKLVEGVDKRLQRKVDETVVSRVRVMDDVVSGELSSVKREMEILKVKLAAPASAGGNDEAARTRLRALEDRLGEIEGDVKDALELGKKAALVSATSATPSGTNAPWWTRFSPSKGSLRSDIMLKSADGQDITALLDQLITSSVLAHLHKDGLSMPDYALFSAGARVIPSLTSPTLELRPPTLSTRLVAYFTSHGYALGRPPVTALHHEVHNGFCWPFSGSEGQLAVALAAPVKVESVSVDHVPKEVAFDIGSAPRDMEVWGLVEGKENVRRVKEWRDARSASDSDSYPPTLPRQPEYLRLANFTYDVDGASHIQNFPVEDDIKQMGLDFGVVVLMVKSNWGRNDLTCLYRFRVHGTRLERSPVE
ncbi:hypothetical protein APHAL10511_007704 [Amanita phalloides]|nr:hypothetical protein APHAL10511_007704 [Amanita phalloides]